MRVESFPWSSACDGDGGTSARAWALIDGRPAGGSVGAVGIDGEISPPAAAGCACRLPSAAMTMATPVEE